MGSIVIRFAVGLLMVATLLVSVLETCEGRGYSEPEDCKLLECAQYKVIHSQKDYEIRAYKMATWVATSPIYSASYSGAVSQGFYTLFEYIQGNNNQKAKLNMTAPVLIDIIPPTGRTHRTSYVVHFYVSNKYQSNPPTSQQAHPVKLPKHHYAAVKRFGGFMNETNISDQLLALKKSLSGSAWATLRAMASRPYSVAGYNSPYEIKNRVNEVIMWFDKF